MIQRAEAEAAITAAREALSQNSGFSWIKKSSLVERAYFLGLFSGLGAIAAEDDLNRLGLTTITNTLWCRSGDDTFPSTKIGQAFSLLKRHLHEHPDTSDRFMIKDVPNLREVIRENERFFQHHLRAIDDVLSRFPTSSSEPTFPADELRSEQHRLLETLEPYLRIVALLETDHLLSKTLDE